MSQTYLVSYATKEFYKSQELLVYTAKKVGITNSFMFRKKDLIKTIFYKENKQILQQKRGAGYWLWKPFFILQILKKVHENDIIIYCDAGVSIIKDLTPLFEKLTKCDCMFVDSPMSHKKWTKKDCFFYMDCDSNKYHQAKQKLGNILLLKQTSFTLKLIEEWLNYAKNPHILTDLPNICGLNNEETFKEHRHDQSILTNLIIKYNLPTIPYEEAMTYFNTHRTRHISFQQKVINKIKRMLNL